MPMRATQAGRRAHAAARRPRRPGLRRELRGPRRGARARRIGRRRADPRSLRDRRAPDVRLRRARPSGSRDLGLSRLDPPDLRRPRRPHPARRRRACACPGPSRPSTTASCAGAVGPERRRRRSRPPRSKGRTGTVVSHRPRRPRRAAGRRRAGLEAGPGAAAATSHPTRRSRAGSRSIPGRESDELEIWIDRGYVPAGYGWSFPAADEVRVGVGSFDPRHHVKEPTVRLADDLDRDAVRYQGNWIPHQLRPAAEDGIFFAGDSAGHCLPLTAEGIRTAFYFGIACGRELRARRRGPQGRASRRCATTRPSRPRTGGSSRRCCASSGWCRGSRPACSRLSSAEWSADGFVDWSFGHYLEIAPPELRSGSAGRAPSAPPSRRGKTPRRIAVARL